MRLKDVAETVDDAENTRLAAWAGTADTGAKPGVILNIRRQPGANVIDTVDRIKALLPQLQSTLPASLDVQVLTDRTVTVRASVRDMQVELGLAVLLVVAVIFVFLRSPSATLIPSVAVPLSLIGTCGVMYLAGFSINNLTLMALTISTGFVVDDAIVMIENIARYVEEGEAPLAAALKGSQQIGFTIISLTISLIAVLIPLLFMGDVVGRLFHEFAITLAVSILISAVVSLTLTPMLCARLLRHTPEESHGRLYRATGHFFDHTIAGYGRMLGWVLNHRGTTWLVFAATLALTVVLYLFIPKGFFPVQDTGTLQATTEADQSISFAGMAERQQAVAERLLQDPAVRSVSSFIGVDGANTTLNTGRLLIDLQPHAQRDKAGVVQQRLAERVQNLPGIRLFIQPVQDLTIEDRVARTQYQWLLSSPDMQQLTTSTTELLRRLRALPELTDVASDLQDQGRQAYVQIDRAQASRLGVTVAGIDAALYNAFGQRLISTIFTQSNQYRVVLEVAPSSRWGPRRCRASMCRRALVRRCHCHRWRASRSATCRWWSTTWASCLRRRFRSTPHRVCRWAMPWPPSSARRPPCRLRGSCRCRWRRAFRGRRWRSRRRCRTRCCSFWRRWSPCTSCWACCMRARCTRSRSCPRCPPLG